MAKRRKGKTGRPRSRPGSSYPGALAAGREFRDLVEENGGPKSAAGKAGLSVSYVNRIIHAVGLRNMRLAYYTVRGHNTLLAAIDALKRPDARQHTTHEFDLETGLIVKPGGNQEEEVIEITFTTRALTAAIIKEGSGMSRHKHFGTRPEVVLWIAEIAGGQAYAAANWQGDREKWDVLMMDEGLDLDSFEYKPFLYLNTQHPVSGLERDLP